VSNGPNIFQMFLVQYVLPHLLFGSISESAMMSMPTGKLGGMNENCATVALPASCQDVQAVCSRVYEIANVLLVSSSQSDTLRFAAQSAAAGSDVLVEVKLVECRALLKVNCEMIVIGQMLLKDLKTTLARI